MATEKLSAQRPNAWLLDFGQSCRAAVGTRTLLQIIDNPIQHSLPCTPPYCSSVLLWQDRLLPVMDLPALLGGLPLPPRYIAVVAYQDRLHESVRFGALQLDALPVAVAVSDEQACPLPEQPSGWSKFAISCFSHQGVAIPVLHPGRIFARPDDAR